MENKIIFRDKELVKRDSYLLGICGENEQEILVFSFEDSFVDGICYLELKFENGEKYFIELEKADECYKLIVKNSILKNAGTIKMQLRIVQEAEKVWKSIFFEMEVFYAINATETIEDDYPNFVDETKARLLKLEEDIEDKASKDELFDRDYNSLNNKPKIPTKTSDLDNDSGFITDYTETDPTVPEYVKNITEQDISKWNNKSEFSGSYDDLTDKPEIPDVSDFITKAVDDLTNYYKKSETYTQEEVNQMISTIPKFAISVVETLPVQNISTTTLYLLVTGDETQNLYTEYIYVNNGWEKLGTQTIDLSDYYTKEQITQLLNSYYTKTDIDTLIASYYTKSEINSKLEAKVDKIAEKGLSTNDYSDEDKEKVDEDNDIIKVSRNANSTAYHLTKNGDYPSIKFKLSNILLANEIHSIKWKFKIKRLGESLGAKFQSPYGNSGWSMNIPFVDSNYNQTILNEIMAVELINSSFSSTSTQKVEFIAIRINTNVVKNFEHIIYDVELYINDVLQDISLEDSEYVVDESEELKTYLATKESVEEMQEEIDELKNKNQDLRNQIPNGEAEGTDITLNDSSNLELESIVVKGQTTQQNYTGVQLFDSNDMIDGYFKNDDGDINGTSVAFYTDKYISVKNNTEIYIRLKALKACFLTRLFIQQYDENKNSIKISYAGIYDKNFIIDEVKKYTLNLQSDTKYIRISAYQLKVNSTDVYPLKDYWKEYFELTCSFVDTDVYEPYVGGKSSPNPDYPQDIHGVKGENTIVISNNDETEIENYTLNLGNKKLCKIEDYQDYIYGDIDDWYLHKEVGEVVLNGSETITRSTTAINGEYRFAIEVPDCKLGLAIPIISTHFRNTLDTTYSNKGIGGRSDTSGFFIYDEALCNMEIDEFKEWLAENNVTVQYPLVTPTTEKITDETLIEQLNALKKAKTYKNVTNISSSGEDLAPIIDVIYKKDCELIDKQVQKLDREFELVGSYTVTDEDVANNIRGFTIDGFECDELFIEIEASVNTEKMPGECLLGINKKSAVGVAGSMSTTSYARYFLEICKSVIPGYFQVKSRYSLQANSIPLFAADLGKCYARHENFKANTITSVTVSWWNNSPGAGTIINVYGKRILN